MKKTQSLEYANRLKKTGPLRWKSLISVQTPYKWNLRRLSPGKTLDIGCGIGRNLKNLPIGSVGIDHNKFSVEYIVKKGLKGYLPNDFQKANYKVEYFDSLLLSHVLEHISTEESIKLIKDYLPYLKVTGKIIIFCPQERGYKSDKSHTTYLNFASLENIVESTRGFKGPVKTYSFPFPQIFGKVFKYNEFVLVAIK